MYGPKDARDKGGAVTFNYGDLIHWGDKRDVVAEWETAVLAWVTSEAGKARLLEAAKEATAVTFAA